MDGSIWDFQHEGLFTVLLVGALAVVFATLGSFGGLLYGLFSIQTYNQLAQANVTNTPWGSTLLNVLSTGATTIQQTMNAGSVAYPLVMYITLFALFLGATLGIIILVYREIRAVRQPIVAVAPVRPM